MSDFSDDAQREYGDAMADGRLDPTIKSEPSLNSPLIDKLVKDVAAIDTSRDMRSEPSTEQILRVFWKNDPYIEPAAAKLDEYAAQKVAEARLDELEQATGYMPAGERTRNYVAKRLKSLKADKE